MRSRWALPALVTLLLALGLVAWSATVQRVGGQAVYNDECRLGLGEAACLEDQEVAGLPLAFLVDSPGVSVIHHVGFEDRFVPWAFALDVGLVWAVLMGVWVAVRRLRLGAGALMAAVVLGAGCGSAPAEPVSTVTVEAYTFDPETGRLVRGELERRDVTVVFDAVAVEDGLLTVSGTAEIEGRGGTGFVRLIEGYDRTGIPEPPPSGPGPALWNGPTLAEGALAYGAMVYRSGRFTLRAPLAEAEADTLLVAYGHHLDWVRVPVADLLAGRRFWASAPGAVPNPEARGVDGLRLRPVAKEASPGDSVRFVLSYRPPPPQRPLGGLALDGVPPEPTTPRSPSFGTSCLWRVERWDEGWQPVPLVWWRDSADGLFECTVQGIAFIAAAERREAFRLSPVAAPGRYRWCLDTDAERGERLVTRAVCSTAFVVAP